MRVVVDTNILSVLPSAPTRILKNSSIIWLDTELRWFPKKRSRNFSPLLSREKFRRYVPQDLTIDYVEW